MRVARTMRCAARGMTPAMHAPLLGPFQASLRACEKKVVLSKALSMAAERLSLTTEQLAARIGVAQRNQYEILRSRVERAHAATDRAKRALNDHVAEHGC